MSFTTTYLAEIAEIALSLDCGVIGRCVELLEETKMAGGRVFVLGVGGSAANASHAVNDLRKIAWIEAYAPTDNIAELTARTNDNGWPSVFVDWLKVNHLHKRDLILVLSVGGGTQSTSQNIVQALKYAKQVAAPIIGIVGRSDGYAAQYADACIVVPVANPEHITQHAENFQLILTHLFSIMLR